ncbi:uncharacterized protein A4U43_C02F16730 [Asparagus officinalis]|uniref:Potassium transporter n=1 Tax=Asparagus officinalis TaxID=4686 RepID=A0A5P1FNT6_ASPOF|nr:uncharacterized protein A4U43_C02F16730 [Asparagus officinalis]
MADAEFDTCNNVEEAEVVENTESTEAPGGRKPSTRKLHRFDSLNMEAGNVSSATSHGANASWAITMHLAFQSIGVVYGDIGTSPLYVYASTFTRGIKHEDDILGVLSLILYTLLLIPLTKYALIVLWANDNGNGGAFALYSLISRYAKVSLLPNQQVEDAMLSNYTLQTPSTKMKRAQWIKGKLEGSKAAKVALIFLTILGTSMIMGDGVLTPCISVLSAVSGIQQKATSLTEGEIAIISIIILIMLFSVQRFGIDKVGYVFAPVILLWFSLIGGIGLYNLFKHDVTVLRAFNPMYIIDYFKRNGKEGWISLGGVVLCITGAEAMFADLGHFNVRAIQISFVGALLPAVSLAYIGQAAYLTKYPENVADTFYKSLPGIAVLCDMTITTCLVTLIMLMIWKKSIWQILPFFVIFGGAELTYLSSVLSKFVQGGFLPLVFSFFLMQIMAIWHYVHVKRYKFEVENKISNTYIKDLALRQDIKRISGVGFLYSELVEGIPPIFAHFIEKVPSIHSVLVFVSVKRLPVTKVEINERFLFRQVEPREYRIYRCVVRYGYKDAIEEAREFESLVIEQLKNFIHNEYTITESSESLQSVIEDEQQFVQKEMEKGIVYLLGETEVVAGKNSSIIKRIVVDYVYNFMRRNFRQGGEAMKIPRSKLLKVGMTYEI